jgi:hypothetical protein
LVFHWPKFFIGLDLDQTRVEPLDFENMSKSLKNEISKFGKFKSDKTDFDKIFENSKQMLNQNHPGIFKRTNSPLKDVKYFSLTTEEEKIDHFEFGFFIYNEDYLPKKKKNQIYFDQFQEQFLIQDVMQNVFDHWIPFFKCGFHC